MRRMTRVLHRPRRRRASARQIVGWQFRHSRLRWSRPRLVHVRSTPIATVSHQTANAGAGFGADHGEIAERLPLSRCGAFATVAIHPARKSGEASLAKFATSRRASSLDLPRRAGGLILLGSIVADMIRAGPSGTFPDGHLRVSGVVTGFMTTIGEAACGYVQLAERGQQ
jgi:hypothetical protein